MAFPFSYSGHKRNCWFEIVNHWDKRDNSVMCTRKEPKSGLKLVRMETDVATHTCKLILRKNLNIGILILFFCKFLRYKGVTQNVDLFHLEIGLA